MVLEPDTGLCTNEDACLEGRLELLQIVSKRDIERRATKDVGPPREVDCEIPYRLERG